MRISNDHILYSFSQYKHTQAVRKEYRIKSFELNILISIYYLTVIQGRTKGIKTRLQKCNPIISQKNIYATLYKLKDKGLILYETTDNRNRYTLELSSEGVLIIDRLFSVQAIESIKDKY